MFLRLLGRIEGLLTVVFLLLTGLFVFGYGLRSQLLPVDMPWHLAQADWMVRHGQVLRADVFNYPRLGKPLVDEYPLYQLVLWLAWKAGPWGMSLLCAALNLLLVGLYAGAARRARLPVGLLAVALFLVLPMLITRLTLRPELVTYLGVAFFTAVLLARREASGWRALWPLPLAQAAWVNCHSGFILGVLMVAGFGAEMVVRRSLRERRFSLAALKVWGPVAALVALACLLNPYGLERVGLPFYHQGNDIIRAYVTEMQGLVVSWDTFYIRYMVVLLAVAAAVVAMAGGRVSFALLGLWLLFGWETVQSQRHIAVFALLFLSVVISAPALRGGGLAWPSARTWSALNAALLMVVTPLLLIPLAMVFGRGSVLSIADSHRCIRDDLNLYPMAATDWLKQQGLLVPVLVRTEAGGWLQLHGFAGLTAGDTGFGKYPPAFVHELGLMCERAGTLPDFVAAYGGQAAIVTHMAQDWPHTLRAMGWRPVFYAPSGGVWLPPDLRPDLPALTPAQIEAAWDLSLAGPGRPPVLPRHYQRVLVLAAHGARGRAMNELLAMPPERQREPVFWEAATALSLADPDAEPSEAVRLLDVAGTLGLADDDRTLPLRLGVLERDGRWEEAAALARKRLARDGVVSDNAVVPLAEALLQAGDRDAARALLERDTGVLLRDGRRYALLARLAKEENRLDEAATAWERACFWWPDDASLRKQADAFRARHPEHTLHE